MAQQWRICLPCRRHRTCGVNPWVRKITLERAWQPIPVFLAGEFCGQGSRDNLQSMGLQRVRHDWSDWAPTFWELRQKVRLNQISALTPGRSMLIHTSVSEESQRKLWLKVLGLLFRESEFPPSTPNKIYSPGGASGKEPTCQCKRHKGHRFTPWVRKIPWRRVWHPTPVLFPGESHGQKSLEGCSP